MKKIILLALFALFVTGCNSGTAGTDQVKKEKEEPDITIPNDLPQQLKEIDKSKVNTAIQFESKSFLDLMDSIFFENRDQEGYQLTTHRVYKAGDQFEIDPDRLSPTARYEVEFLKFNYDERKFETILEKTVERQDPSYFITIPDEENAVYYIEQVALGEMDEIRKQEYHQIFVPYNERNARIDLDKTHYSPEEKMTVTLTNLGTIELGTGYGVILEKWNGEAWAQFEFEQMVTLQMFILRNGGTFSQDVELSQLEKGTYRVIQTLTEDDRISASFTIE
ncbi:immunoglobulin-like domain-containing protein [Cytobacillus gottheilii]|uniref:Lipoprotein n=1 Tax=Cytobacillus gottheilii TaxID=859144 RepID=A0ABX8FA84_9BACI|nr:immunoglobulin-like domain-containing protein [Cytobacillus gottheilii]QVY61084.1 lipoprotein [Cytobacillus gottheilii]